MASKDGFTFYDQEGEFVFSILPISFTDASRLAKRCRLRYEKEKVI